MKSIAIVVVLAIVGGGAVVGPSPITRLAQPTEVTDASTLTRTPRCSKQLETPRRNHRPNAPDRPPVIIAGVCCPAPVIRAGVLTSRAAPHAYESRFTSTARARAPPALS